MSNLSAEQPKQAGWEKYSEFGMFKEIGNFDQLTIVEKIDSAFTEWLFENIKEWDYVYCKYDNF